MTVKPQVQLLTILHLPCSVFLFPTFMWNKIVKYKLHNKQVYEVSILKWSADKDGGVNWVSYFSTGTKTYIFVLGRNLTIFIIIARIAMTVREWKRFSPFTFIYNTFPLQKCKMWPYFLYPQSNSACFYGIQYIIQICIQLRQHKYSKPV